MPQDSSLNADHDHKKLSGLRSSKVFLAKNGAVATEHPIASMAAIDILRAGGNAVDAAVTASFCLTVTQPHLSGLGGDFFALYYDAKSGKVHCLNSSGWAPSGFTISTIRSEGHTGIPPYGPYSVVVPGYARGVGSLHERFGMTEFSNLLAPAIRLTQDGFLMHPGLSRHIHQAISEFPTSAKQIFAPNGQPLVPGSLLRQERLERTLKTISQEGVDAFYDGWISKAIVSELSKEGLQADPTDFTSFQSEWCEPLAVTYRDFTVYEIPPNSMGATSLLILKSLENVGLRQLKPNSQERVEAMLKVVTDAYSRMRTELGDPRFTRININHFLSPQGTHGMPEQGYSTGNADTTYFAVVDRDGNMLSVIQSLFHYFGSRIFPEACGFFLNNRASAFKLDGPNKLEPRKRPLHTLSALLLERDGEMRAAIGTSGGEFRPQQHALFVTNLADYEMNLEDALAYPRFLLNPDGRVMAEHGFTDLNSLGRHIEVIEYPSSTGVAQGVEVFDGTRKAVCDIRGEGLPLGF
jgi:gamma-glutamyltranspeptidase/glutathione hydrolase